MKKLIVGILILILAGCSMVSPLVTVYNEQFFDLKVYDNGEIYRVFAQDEISYNVEQGNHEFWARAWDRSESDGCWSVTYIANWQPIQIKIY